MIYKDLEGCKPAIIDFGKACKVEDGKAKRSKKQNIERLYRTLNKIKKWRLI